ncbi:RecQ family ATP-dependent DNA helicase [Levilactobacillus bambusae]|nr:RecQ family ATP-dependent DNA helicase [Levilactobacillus bambusae]
MSEQLESQLYEALDREFGFKTFRTGQLESLASLMQGRDTLAVLPTGAGKTLIYELYATIKSGTVLVISPLLSLMQDQVGRLQAAGRRKTVALTSLTDLAERRSQIQRLDQYRIVFLSPEMLVRTEIQERLRQMNISLFVVDEAHCITQWGPDFRPEYLLLGQARKMLNQPLTLMLTATASSKTQEQIIQRLGVPNANRIMTSVNRANIFLAVETVSSDREKGQRLADLVRSLPKPGVVYFSSKRAANQVAANLNELENVEASPYHADLDGEQRYKIQQQFMAGQLNVICATSAFGMGIDKADIRFVIHYHLPTDLENYSQEIGRAGRDGQPSLAILLYQPGDEQFAWSLSQASIPDEALIQRFYQHPSQFHGQDEQVDLLKFYQAHGVNELAAQQLFSDRMKARRTAIQEMMTFVTTQGCRREILLQKFQPAPYPTHNAECCNGEDTPVPTLLGSQTEQKPTQTVKGNWQSRLASLFL